MRGFVVFSFVFDLGGPVAVPDGASLWTDLPGLRVHDTRKVVPRYVGLPGPHRVRFEPVELETDLGVASFEMFARVYALGALSLTVRVPVEAPDFEALRRWRNVRVREGGDALSVEAWVQRWFSRMMPELAPSVDQRYEPMSPPVRYVVYALEEVQPSGSELLRDARREIAGLLANEADAARLSRHAVDEHLRHRLQYFEDDLVVVHSGAALVVKPWDHDDDWEELYVMELASVQLLSLRAFDTYLDDVLEGVTRDLHRFFGRSVWANARVIQRELSSARVDLTRVRDTIENTGKVYWDASVVDLHERLKARFHFASWESVVEEKMKTVNELYTLATQEVRHRQTLVLEVAILLLFVVWFFI